ncbi:hypothetical protein CLV30_1262 [Haloactinopolyspora alba]|uniref:Uncharacterized protein n=1 Tax=Haloactinopolyspora alba TaxID=648780 RepID=A0A2P8DGK8_9ACTN|nr:hypothetical protein [Haloactinopolyspora alba]PSK96343.1 hypothetical protein CLV30_1262 [Haloactinopolyspora alba]
MSGYVGWLVRRRLPTRPLDHIIVTDARGVVVAHRPLPYGAESPGGWDRTLVHLGFERTGGWVPTAGGFACRTRGERP